MSINERLPLMQYFSELHSTGPHSTILHYTTLHYTTLHYTTLHWPTLHSTIPNFTKQNSTTLHHPKLSFPSPHWTEQCTTLYQTNTSPCYTATQSFQNIFPITDIATYRLNQPRGQCSENHLKCITRWKGRDGVTITIFVQHTMDGHKTGFL